MVVIKKKSRPDCLDMVGFNQDEVNQLLMGLFIIVTGLLE